MPTASPFRPHALLSFPFFGLGLASFLILITWLVLDPTLPAAVERGPLPLTFVHLTILGWLLPFVFGAAYQLIPVIAETRLRSPGLAFAHLALHLLAAPQFLNAILHGDFASAARWGGLVALGVVVGVANLLVTAAHRSRWSPDNIGLAAALFWLIATVGLGLVLALARVGVVTAIPAERILQVHALCGLLGFFLTTLVAVSFKLVPMFLLSAVHTRARAWAALAGIHGGLLVLVPALLGGFAGLVAGAAVLIGLGVLCFLVEISVLIARRRRPLDWPLRCYVVGIIGLGPVTVLGVLAALAAAGVAVWSPARPTAVIFALGVFGVLTPSILGMAGKIVPFLAWQWRYAAYVGRLRVPLVAELFSDRLLRAQAVAVALAVAALAAGVLASQAAGIRLGALGLLVSGGLFTANVVRLVRRMRREQLSPLVPVASPRPRPAAAAVHA